MMTRLPIVTAAALVLILTLGGCAATVTNPDDSGGSTTTDTGQTEADDTSTDDSATSSAVPTLTSGPETPGLEMQMATDGITPNTLSIAVGDTVIFTSGDGGFHGLLVNGLASVTVAENLPEYYQFTEPGTYTVADELSDATATITVG